jgi:hypothetical protein
MAMTLEYSNAFVLPKRENRRRLYLSAAVGTEASA